jgi:predicted amidohydrolase
MNDLNVTFIQTELFWESPEANLAMFEEKIWQIDGATDLILLPEMFTTGFSMNTVGHSEPHGSKTLKWMQQMATQTGACIVGSCMIRDGRAVYNRLYCVQPDGTHQHYDKRHLFRMGREHNNFQPGARRLVVSCKGWNICPLICYDLRFPVWSRNVTRGPDATPEYDLLIYVANWPASRNSVWRTLLQARAVENLCYSAGLNITGTDGEGVAYCGNSLMTDYKGEPCLDMSDEQRIASVTINKNQLEEFRKKFPAHLDADAFKLLLNDQ